MPGTKNIPCFQESTEAGTVRDTEIGVTRSLLWAVPETPWEAEPGRPLEGKFSSKDTATPTVSGLPMGIVWDPFPVQLSEGIGWD